MRRNAGVIIWVVVGVLLAALAFAAAFFLPFWDYSTTYAPIMPTQPAPATTPTVGAIPEALYAVSTTLLWGELPIRNSPQLGSLP